MDKVITKDFVMKSDQESDIILSQSYGSNV